MLPVGKYQYKYLVDGAWTYDPTQPCVPDSFGSWNNIVEIYPKKTAGEERIALQKAQLACVLLDLFRSHETNPDVYLGIRKSPELWKEIPERYNPLGMGGETLRGIIDRLHSLNYIDITKGSNPKPATHRAA